jgi:hypothetical protein
MRHCDVAVLQLRHPVTQHERAVKAATAGRNACRVEGAGALPGPVDGRPGATPVADMSYASSAPSPSLRDSLGSK